jgi:gliding motility-associated-like protein
MYNWQQAYLKWHPNAPFTTETNSIFYETGGAAGPLWSFATTQQSPILGGLCALCLVETPTQAIDGDTTTSSRLVLPIGVVSTVGQRLNFPGDYQAGDYIALELEVPNQLLSGQLLGGINVVTYNNGVSNNDQTFLNASAIKVEVFGIGNGSTSKFRAVLTATKSFNAVQVNITSALAALGSLRIYEVAAGVPSTVSPASPKINSGQSATLTATNRLPNATFKWYATAKGGTALFTGPAFNTPALNKNTTYYIETTTTTDNITSYVRTPVTVTVNKGPGPLWAHADSQQSPITGGLACALCLVDSAANAVDGDTTTASRLVLPIGIATTLGQRLYFPGYYQAGDWIALDLEVPNQLISGQLLGGINFETFKDSVANNDQTFLNNSLVKVQFLGIGIGATNKFRVVFPIAHDFDAVQVNITSGLAALGNLKIYEATAMVPATVTPANPEMNVGQNISLAATSRLSGATFRWYANPTGGAALFTGPNFTTPNLTRTTTYYVETVDAGGNLTSFVRTPVTVIVRGGPGPLWIYADSQQSPITGGIACALCYVDSAARAVDGDTTTASRLVLPVGVATSLGQRLYFPGNYQAGDYIALDLEVPNQIISGQLLGGINIETFQDSVANGDQTYLNGSLVNVEFLGIGTGNNNKFRAIIPVNKAFNAVQVNISSLIAGLGSLKIYEAVAFAPVDVNPDTVVIANNTSAALSASIRFPNAQFSWYQQPTGGTAVGAGATFNTPPLTKAATYYVAATTPDNLTSYVRTPVTVRVAGAPGPIWTYGDDQESPITGGIACAGCTINNPLLAADGDTSTGSTFVMPIGVLGTVGQLVKFPGVYYPGDSIVLIMETPDNLLTGQLLPGISLETYKNTILGPAIPNDDEIRLNAAIVRVDLLGLGVNNNRKFKVTIPVQDTFDAVRVNLAPAASLSLAEPLKLYEAAAMVPVTVSPSPATVNYGKTATLTPSIRIPNATFNWYVSPTGGTPMGNGVFTTLPLTRNATYYVEAVDPTGKTSLHRTAVPVTVAGGTGPLWTFGIEQESPRTGGIACALCSVAGPELAVDGDTSTRSRLSMPVGVSTFVGQYIRFPAQYQAGDSVVLFLATQADPLANANLLAGIRVQTYLGDTPNGDATTLNAALINLQLLGLNDGLYHFRISFPATKPFDGTQVDLVSLVGLSSGLYVSEAAAMMPVQVTRINPPSDTIPAGQTATFEASIPRIPDATFSWYETPTGGTPVFTGANFTTPPLLQNKTYYVEAFSPVDGLHSLIRTAVPITVLPVNELACGAANTQSSGTSGVACLGCTVIDGALAVDNDPETSSELRVGIGLLGGVFQALGFPSSSGADDTLRIGISSSTRLLDAGLLTGLTFTLYNGATQVRQYNNTALLNLRLFGDTAYAELVFAPGAAFDSVKVEYNALLAAVSNIRLHYAKVTAPGARVQDSLVRVCSGGSVTLTAVAPAGATFRWYKEYTGGTPIFTGPAFTANNITSDTTFFVEAVSPGTNCGSNARTPVSVKLGLPEVTVTPTTIRVRRGQSATFNITTPNPNYTYKWYNAATGGTALFTGPQFITPAIDSNTVFYAEADSAGCTSRRTPVYVTITTAPAAPVIIPDTAFVSPGQTATFRIANPDPALTYRWYNTDSGGAVLGTDTIYTTPAVTANGNIYAEAVNASNESSERTRAVVQLISGPGSNLPCTYSNAQESPVYIGLLNLCLLCGVTDPANAIDGDLNTPSRVTATLGTGSIGQMLHFGQPGVAGDSIRLVLGLPGGLADAQLLGGVRVQTYNNGAPVGAPVFLNASILRLALLTGSKFEAVLPAEGTFDAVLVTLGGLLTAVTTLEIYNAEQVILPAKPSADSDSLTVCLGSSARLVARDTAGITVQWYAAPTGGAPLFTGGIFNTPALNQPGTTYYIASSRNGCANPVRVPVTVRAVAQPAVPQLTSATTSICVGDTAKLTVASPQPGVAYRWYDAPAGGNLVDTGALLNIIPATTGVDTISYFVEAGVSECVSANRAKGDVYVSANCGGSGGGDTTALTICAGSSTTLTVDSVITGATYRWYNAANSSLVFTGTSFVTPVLNASINYILTSTISGVIDTVRFYQLTVTSSLDTPALVAGEIVTTPGGTATFIINGPQGGVMYKWYSSPTGGTPLDTGTSFTTPPLAGDSAKYYVEASAGACVSPVRGIATVKASDGGNGQPCYTANTTQSPVYTPPISVCLLCGVADANNAVDGDTTTASRVRANIGIGYIGQVLNFQQAGLAGDSIRLVLGLPGGLADAQLLGGVRVQAYSGGAPVGNPVFLNGGLSAVRLTLLSGNRFVATIAAPVNYDAVYVSVGGVLTALTTLEIYNAEQLLRPAKPSADSDSLTACLGASAKLTATDTAGVTVKWYASASGGTALFTGGIFNTPALTQAITTYYIETSRNGCPNPQRIPVQVRANDCGGPGGDTTAVTICRGTSTTLGVDTVQAGAVYQWYNAANDSLVFTGPNFTTPVLNANITYRLEAAFTGGFRDTVQIYPITVTDPPVVPVLTNSTFISCQGGPATLSVLNPVPGVIYNWYNVATGGTPIGSDANFTVTPPAGADSTKYYAEAAIGSCTSTNRATATVRSVSSLPTPSLVLNEQVVPPGGSATFTIAAPQAGVTYKWYSTASGGTPLDSGTSFTTPPLSGDSATYYVEASAGSCLSADRAAVRVRSNSNGGGDSTAITICRGSSATLTVTNPVPGATYRWYNTANNSQVGTGASFVTPVLNANATYLLEATLQNGTKDTVQIYPITVTDPPVVPVLANSTVISCDGGPVQLAVLNPQAGLTYNWYDAPTGGNLLGTGVTFTVTPPAGADSTKYYAGAAVGNCISTNRATATVRSVSNLQPPVLTTNQQSTNLGGTATFTIANPQGGITYKWYSTATGGTPLHIGPSFTTPPLAADSVKYYVEASAGTCVSGTRAILTVKNNNSSGGEGDTTAITLCTGSSITLNVVNPQGGVTYRWYNTANNSLVFTGANFTTPVLNANITYLVEATLQGGAKDTNHVYQITVSNNTTPPVVVASVVKICNGQDAVLIVQNPLPGFSYQWFDAATGGSLVYTGPVFTVAAVTGNRDYYVQSSLGDKCASLTRTKVSIQAGSTPTAPAVAANNVLTCIGGTATFSIQGPDPAVSYRWYNQPSGGTLLAIGTAYTTAGLNSTTTFYVEAAYNAGCVSTVRTGVTATVVNSLDAPLADAVNTCTGQSAVLTVKNPRAGLIYRWYSTATGGTALFTGNSYTTPPRTANTVYYLEAASGSGCVSVSRTPVSVTVNAVPNTPLVLNAVVRVCPGQTANLSVENPDARLTYRWYTSPTGGTAVTTGATFMTDALTANQQYYVEAVNAGGCASSQRTGVSVTVGAPGVNDITVEVPDPECQGQVTLTASAPTVPNASFRWYSTATGGAVLFTGAAFTTPALSRDTIFYVEVFTPGGGCTSATRKSVAVNVLQPLPAPVVRLSDSTATSVTFSWNAVAGATRYEVSIDNGATFVPPGSGANGTTHTVSNLSPNQAVSLQVRALNTNSCQNGLLSAAITGRASNPAGNQVYVPNLFSPNGDGVNDVLMVYGNTIATLELHIYNSWGQEVFVSKDQRQGWTGIMNGKLQPAGVYVYIVVVKLQNGSTVNKKGNVTLIR